MKLWAGRTSAETDTRADELNSSIRFDKRMYREDIRGSVAHAEMLAKQGIISEAEADEITKGLRSIEADLSSGALPFDEHAEDIHMFIEQVLTERIGDAGKKLHTARSRNDQVALDLRLYLRNEIDEIKEEVSGLIIVLRELAEKYRDAVMPGYTHLQRAQPILFSHQLLAYAMMLLRDLSRLQDCRKRMNESPIGACALAGTTYDTDRAFEAAALGFDGVMKNSLDAVSDRDFAVELASVLSILMMHLSRFSEELILWSSREFRFIEFSDDFTTGSSIMPQKKNPDMAELVRGKTGRVYGDLTTLLTLLKGLPLAYNKDMQEDKEAIFDAVDTVRLCLSVFTPMLSSMRVFPDNMRKAAQEGFINATDLADYLVKKGLPFREAYKIAGELVTRCEKDGFVLETLPLMIYREYSALFEEDVYEEISIDNCIRRRSSEGGTSPESVEKQLRYLRDQIS